MDKNPYSFIIQIKRNPQKELEEIYQLVSLMYKSSRMPKDEYDANIRALRLVQEHFETVVDVMWANCRRGDCDKFADIIKEQLSELRRLENKK